MRRLTFLLLAAALSAAPTAPPPSLNCRQAPGPIACYACCIAQRGQVPERSAEKACLQICRSVPEPPASESRPR